jgi:hypothetical protein
MKIITNFPNENKDERKNHYVPISLALVFMVILVIICLIAPTSPEKEQCPDIVAEPIQTVQEAFTLVVEAKEEPAPTDDDIIASVVMAEAGNQGMLGKVAVATTILNRADYYDMTVESVVTEPNQYSYPYYGEITDECYRAVEIARNNRDLFPPTMFWFRTKNYHKIGEPLIQIQDHYFSYLQED